MPVKYSLRYLPAAEADLESIFNFIARDSPRRAVSYLARIDKKLSLLETHPLAGSRPRDHRLREKGYRVLILDNYLAFYVIRGRRIEVRRVLHASRNLDHLL